MTTSDSKPAGEGNALLDGSVYKVHVSTETLDDLRRRLMATRWPADVADNDRFYGTTIDYMKELVDYWISSFDWRAAESKINEYQQYRLSVDEVPLHFIRQKGVGPNPIPLILSHGWPWSFWDWEKVIRPLADPGAFGGDPADAFDVVVPSMPGFGFSAPTRRFDLNFWKTADILHTLMSSVLGHQRYAAGGADLGAAVTGQLGHKYASSLYGIWIAHGVHLDLFQNQRPWDISAQGGDRYKVSNTSLDLDPDRINGYAAQKASHVAVHMLDSQDLSYGLSDSPVGMLAWILRRWTKWSESNGNVESVFTRDHLLTNATIWWASQTITTSIRSYVNAHRYPWTPSHDRRPIVEAPTGITFLGGENPPGVSIDQRVANFRASASEADWYNTVYIKGHERGGHFTAWENPEAVIKDIQTTFRALR